MAWTFMSPNSSDQVHTMINSTPTLPSSYVFLQYVHYPRSHRQLQAAFKNYINAFVTRYKNEPTILAWELANEPRCKGSAG